MTNITFDDFCENLDKLIPQVTNPDVDDWHDYIISNYNLRWQSILIAFKENKLWSLVWNDDGDDLVIEKGLRYVNREGYFIEK